MVPACCMAITHEWDATAIWIFHTESGWNKNGLARGTQGFTMHRGKSQILIRAEDLIEGDTKESAVVFQRVPIGRTPASLRFGDRNTGNKHFFGKVSVSGWRQAVPN